MPPVAHTELINIVVDWTDKNADALSQGRNIKSPCDLLRYERILLLLLIQLGALIMEWVLKTRIEDKDFQSHASQTIISAKARRYRFMSYVTTPIRTLFGNIVKIRTRYYTPRRHRRGRRRGCGKRGANGSGLFPVLKFLGIRNGVTPALASDVSREVTEGPSMEAAQERLSRMGIDLDIKIIQRVSETFAATGLTIRNEWVKTGGRCKTPLIPEDESLTGLRILIGTDGGRVRTRKNKRGRISRGLKRHGFDTPWREPKLFTIRAVDAAGKVIRERTPIYEGTLDDADGIFDLLEAHLRARNVASASEIICAGDGAPWIWERIDCVLARLGVDPSKVSHVVDFYHAVEHLAKIADDKRVWNERKRKRWLNRMRSSLKHGGIDMVIDELKSLAKGRNARAVMREVRYFEEHRERMRYDLLEKKGLPLGNGAMESAIRQVVNMRLKGAGMFWHEHNAEGFLHLRCYLKARKWDIMEQAVIAYDGVLG